MEFINRKHELNHLEEEYAKKGAKLIVVYGRRRVGKTRLIEEFSKGKDSAYYLAAQETDKQQIQDFKNRIAEKLGDSFLLNMDFSDWKQLFAYLGKAWPKDRHIILVLDECNYIIKSNPAFPSYLQNFWDTSLSKTNTFLILSGSLVSMIVKEVLSSKSPLYGRRTSQILLKPFTFSDSMKFMPGFGMEDAITFYSITGGVAKYLLFIEEGEPPREFIRNKFLGREGFFYPEGALLFSQEFRDFSTYLDIVKSIAMGNSSLVEIANFAGLSSKIASSYLDILITLGFVERIVPVTENPRKFRGGIYGINDNFLKFWNRFVYPNRSLIEMRDVDGAMKKVEEGINPFVGRSFERVCGEAMAALSKKGEAPPTIGTWWGSYREGNERKTAEIDLVALDEHEKEVLFAECKWSENVDAPPILAELKKKAQLVEWNKGKRKEKYAIFAKSFGRRADEEGVLLFDLKDLERIFRKAQGE